MLCCVSGENHMDIKLVKKIHSLLLVSLSFSLYLGTKQMALHLACAFGPFFWFLDVYNIHCIQPVGSIIYYV